MLQWTWLRVPNKRVAVVIFFDWTSGGVGGGFDVLKKFYHILTPIGFFKFGKDFLMILNRSERAKLCAILL